MTYVAFLASTMSDLLARDGASHHVAAWLLELPSRRARAAARELHRHDDPHQGVADLEPAGAVVAVRIGGLYFASADAAGIAAKKLTEVLAAAPVARRRLFVVCATEAGGGALDGFPRLRLEVGRATTVAVVLGDAGEAAKARSLLRPAIAVVAAIALAAGVGIAARGVWSHPTAAVDPVSAPATPSGDELDGDDATSDRPHPLSDDGVANDGGLRGRASPIVPRPATKPMSMENQEPPGSELPP